MNNINKILVMAPHTDDGEFGCGICVNPLDPKEIADAVFWLLDNQKEVERMGLRGIRTVEERYNWGREEEKLLYFYSELI